MTCSRCGLLHRVEGPLPFRAVCARCASASAASRFHPLDRWTVADVVDRTSPGNFALGYHDGSAFAVLYVGRSDSDVGAELLRWSGGPSRPRRRRPRTAAPWSAPPDALPVFVARVIGSATLGSDTAYTHFSFSYAPSPTSAFERQCHAFHDLGGSGGLDNAGHPRPPADCFWPCPVHG